MTFVLWFKLVGPILGMLWAHLSELRKTRSELMRIGRVMDQRHEDNLQRHAQHSAALAAHDVRLSALERAK
jgi:hypothetical protein